MLTRRGQSVRLSPLIIGGAVLVSLVWLIVSNQSGARAAMRPPTAEELDIPSPVLNRLTADLGLAFATPTDAMIPDDVATEAVALARAQSEYASQASGAITRQYLLQVEGVEEGIDTGMKQGRLVWLIHFSDVAIPSGAPLTESGTPAEPAIIRNGYALLDAMDGSFILSHWTE